jgi:hypothetical protein
MNKTNIEHRTSNIRSIQAAQEIRLAPATEDGSNAEHRRPGNTLRVNFEVRCSMFNVRCFAFHL